MYRREMRAHLRWQMWLDLDTNERVVHVKAGLACPADQWTLADKGPREGVCTEDTFVCRYVQ